MQFIHDSIATDAIIERFVEGRELYCGVIGNQRLQVLPVWEMTFSKMPEGQHRIATERVKWNVEVSGQDGRGHWTREGPPRAPRTRSCSTPRAASTKFWSSAATPASTCGSTTDGRVYVLEANPNPQIARNEDFAESAALADSPIRRCFSVF